MLSNLHGFSFRGEKILLSSREQSLLSEFAKIVRSNEEYKYFFDIPEINSQLLRCILTEMLYVAVEKDSGSIFFITDRAGENYLRRMLSDIHTLHTDLNTNLLKHQKNKIFIISKLPANVQQNDIFVFFRMPELFRDIIYVKHAIFLITLRDIYKSHDQRTVYFDSLIRNGWNKLPVSCQDAQETQESNKIVKNNIVLKVIKSNTVEDFFNAASSFGLMNGSLEKYVNNFGSFYLTIPIPFKYYDHYKNEKDADDVYIPTMMPSQSAGRIPGITIDETLVLVSLCSKIEKALEHDNPKFTEIIASIKANSKEGGQIALILPNKIIADAFEWSLFENKLARGFGKDDIKFFYPESLFIEALEKENTYSKILIPFVTSFEMLLASYSLTETAHFILYPQEKGLLNFLANEANNSISDYWKANDDEICFFIDTKKGMLKRDQKITNIEKMVPQSYDSFLSYLSEGDPKEGDQSNVYKGTIDSNTYQITSTDGIIYEIHGWEHLILFNEREKLPYRRYSWISPAAIQKRDKIYLISRDVRLEYLRKEISESLKEHSSNIRVLIDYIAEWKEALILTNKRYSNNEIQKRLSKHGLKRTYLTVKKWFDSILDDPEESAINSIIDSNSNIGPKSADDIRIFGEAFGIKNLKENFKEIHSAMKVFRVNNQHIGKIAMQKIISDLNNEGFLDNCLHIAVKSTRVKNKAK
ncbi:MAG: hypothetical protein QCI00_02930 [Candidatus Thermoplasmatota archaeon]|nr:hypothetical protein [Candidatus Thermoplasmatota archaeon]